jgi:hypothetical protein
MAEEEDDVEKKDEEKEEVDRKTGAEMLVSLHLANAVRLRHGLLVEATTEGCVPCMH